jgi:non-ribosomal peptide synthetase component F
MFPGNFARTTPDKDAVVMGSGAGTTYRELDERSEQLAHLLRARAAEGGSRRPAGREPSALLRGLLGGAPGGPLPGSHLPAPIQTGGGILRGAAGDEPRLAQLQRNRGPSASRHDGIAVVNVARFRP